MKLLCILLLCIASACSSPPPPKKSGIQFTQHDKVLFAIGECSRTRKDSVARECLHKFKTHVFKGKVLQADFAYTGVEAVVNLGNTQVTCHIHPTEQTYAMLKSLLIGDVVAVNGLPEEFHNSYSYNNLVLRDCTLLPIKRYSPARFH